MRLDKFLQEKLHESRNQVAHLISDGLVEVAHKRVTKAGFKLKEEMEVTVTLLEAQPIKHQVDFDVAIIYEDEDLLIVNKPSGLVVHPAPSVKEATLVDWLKAKGINLSTINGKNRHGIVHRLDKETSGALVVAKNNEAHQKLSQQLQDKSMGRYYLAVVDMELKENCIVDKKIGRNPANRLKMAVVQNGKEAKTAFKKLTQATNSRYELIAAKLYTGRTHQIRVHLNSLSRHILGDVSYGFKREHAKISRIFLHAYIMYLKHPVNGQKMHFIAPLPDDYTQILGKNFDMEKVNEKIQPQYIIDSFTCTFERVYR
ncbi:MAG: RluA family pseudouridine synthase [Campylobacterota bacterium]